MRSLLFTGACSAAVTCTMLAASPVMAEGVPQQATPQPSSPTIPASGDPASPVQVATTASQDATDATGPQRRSSGGVEDIVVTAQRRTERLQNVPVAVTAASAARISAVGITSTQEIAEIAPGLTVQQTAGFTQPYIRGVGSSTNGPGLEAPIATYVDGVYIAAAPAALLTLNNIDRIEVLKGPQGTLFGRNATGGLIQVVTKDPSQKPTLDVNLSDASYRDVTADAYVSGGLAAGLAADLAVRYEHQDDGWGRNLKTGSATGDLPHDFAARAKFVLDHGTTQVKLAFDYEDRISRREVQHVDTQYPATFNNAVFGGPFPLGGPYDINNDIDPTFSLKAGGVSLQVKHNLSDSVVLQSITAYRQSWYNATLDVDQTPIPYINLDLTSQDRQFSQELQLSSTGNGRLKWTAGLFYFNAVDRWTPQDIDFGPTFVSPAPGLPATIRIRDREDTNSVAGYAQATYAILQGTNLTVGGRYTYERKEESGGQDVLINGSLATSTGIPVAGTGNPSTLDFKRFNYRVALDHHFGTGVLAYVSYGTGFKSGGFNINMPENPPFAPETIGAAEVGLKTQFLGNKVRINTSGFHYEYSNIQVGRYFGAVEDIYNGAKARIYGADLDSEVVLLRGLSITSGLSWTHARFSSFPLADFIVPVAGCVPAPGGTCSGSATGKALPFAPEFTFNVGGNWRVTTPVGAFNINANYFHTSHYFSNPDNVAFQPAYGILNASIGWTDRTERLSVRAFAKNLTDVVYSTELVEASQGLIRAVGAPRTFGVTLGYKY